MAQDIVVEFAIDQCTMVGGTNITLDGWRLSAVRQNKTVVIHDGQIKYDNEICACELVTESHLHWGVYLSADVGV